MDKEQRWMVGWRTDRWRFVCVWSSVAYIKWNHEDFI